MFTPRITRMLFAGVVAAGTVLATTGPALADTLIQHSRFHGTGLTLFSARCTAFDTPLTPGGQKCENIELAAANGFETGSGRTASTDAVVSYSVEFLNSAGNIVPSLSRETTGDTFNNGGSVAFKSAALNSATVTGSVNVQTFVDFDFDHPVGAGVYRVSVKATGTGQTERDTSRSSFTGKGSLTFHSTDSFLSRAAVVKGNVGPFAGTSDGHLLIIRSGSIEITRQ